MQGVAVVAVVAITLGAVGVLLMSRGVRHAPLGSVNGPRYTVTTSLMAAKGGPLNACFAMPLPLPPIGCGGVEVANVDVASIPGVVTYANGTVGTPIVKLVGTWDGHVFRLTEQPRPATPGESTEAKLVPQAPPIASKESPQQVVEHLKQDTSDLQKRGIIVFAFGAAADGVEMTVAVADDKTVQYLFDRYGRVYIKGWLQPVGRETPIPSRTPTIALPTTAEISAPSRDVVWALIASSALFRSTDQGTSWERRSMPLLAGGGRPPEFSFVDAQNGWFSTGGVPETQCNGAGAGVWRTTDGAATWQLVATAPTGPSQRTDSGIAYAQCKEGLSFIDMTHGFLGAWDPNHRPTVYGTTDAGKSWSASTLPDPPGFVSGTGGSMLRLRLLKGFGSTLLALADANRPPGYVFRSTDGGVTWAYLATLNSGSDPVFVTVSRWLVIGNDGSGQETTDAGKSWHSFSTDYADAAGVASTFVFADGSVGYGTVRGGVQRTVDGGLHWTRIVTPGTPVPAPGTATDSCAGTPSGLASAPSGDNFKVVVRVPDGWTASVPGHDETTMLVLNAPSSYTHQPTKISTYSFIGYFKSETLEQVAANYYGPHGLGDLVGPLTRCTVGGEPALFFMFKAGDRAGYLVLFLHFNYLYGLQLDGAGGIDTRAWQDAKKVLGSWTWTVATPPAR
jgi:photosystem II stability/assembly factor-like uncharacterized protein